MHLLLIYLLSGFIAFSSQLNDPSRECKNSEYILNQSKRKYDTDQQWSQTELKLHVQEPRVETPQRYSRIALNNRSNYFEIERSYDEGIIKRIIDEDGSFRALLDENASIPAEIIEKYGLNLERSAGYRKFYQAMYGLPMSITDDFYNEIAPAEVVEFDDQPAYQISLRLTEAMISEHWRLMISTEDYSLLGLEFYHPDDPQAGELIKFEDTITLAEINLPRMRHWYEKQTNEYLGSDIIVEEIE